MNDPLSVARRLRSWADEPGLPPQKREDLLSAVDMLRSLHQMLNAKTEKATRQ